MCKVIMDCVETIDLNKAALRGEPSHVWRAGQERRLNMIRKAAGECMHGRILDDGCGVGMYVSHMSGNGGQVFGLEYEYERVHEARVLSDLLVCGAGEGLPYPDGSFDLILSHEVLEHVRDDRAAVEEIVRTLRTGGRLVLFAPNRGYPFETHGIYWNRKYHFGNIPLVNYLPKRWRDKLAPHVRVYGQRDLECLFEALPVTVLERTVIFGAYDNIIARFGALGRTIRSILRMLERTPLRILGLSHFWVVEKSAGNDDG